MPSFQRGGDPRSRYPAALMRANLPTVLGTLFDGRNAYGAGVMVIRQITLSNTTAAAITGTINVNEGATTVPIINALAVAANSVQHVQLWYYKRFGAVAQEPSPTLTGVATAAGLFCIIHIEVLG